MLSRGLICFVLLATAASVGRAQSPAQPPPPSAKQILRVLLANGAVPLSTDPSCRGVGSEPSDATLGDYVSGLLANFAATGAGEAKNSIVVSAKPVRLPTGEQRWECHVEFVHVPGEDPFRYGVLFQMQRQNGDSLIRGTVRCTGGG